MPRSPRWLLSRGHTEEALRVLKRLHGGKAEDDVFALEEFYQVRGTSVILFFTDAH